MRGQGWLAIGAIVSRTGIPRKRVQRKLGGLEKRGLLPRTRRSDGAKPLPICGSRLKGSLTPIKRGKGDPRRPDIPPPTIRSGCSNRGDSKRNRLLEQGSRRRNTSRQNGRVFKTPEPHLMPRCGLKVVTREGVDGADSARAQRGGRTYLAAYEAPGRKAALDATVTPDRTVRRIASRKRG
jgi:hypothetical protein